MFSHLIYRYPDLTVELSFYNAHIAEGEPQLLEHTRIEWITPEEIDG